MADIWEAQRRAHYPVANASVLTLYIQRDANALSNATVAQGLYGTAGFLEQPTCFQVSSVPGGPKINAGLVGQIRRGSADRDLVIAFRGTIYENKDHPVLPTDVRPTPEAVCADWTQDRIYEPSNWNVEGEDYGSVCGGIARAANSVWQSVVDAMPDDNALLRFDKIWITGHSKGGAMALLLAPRLFQKYRNVFPKMQVVTFAAPCVAGRAFVSKYTDYGYDARTVRYQNHKDLVPLIPNIDTPDMSGAIPACAGVGGVLTARHDYTQTGFMYYISKNAENVYWVETDQTLANAGYMSSIDPPPSLSDAMAAHQPTDYLGCLATPR